MLLDWHKNQGEFGWMKIVTCREHGKGTVYSSSRFLMSAHLRVNVVWTRLVWNSTVIEKIACYLLGKYLAA